jgi:hypothetical protein
MQQPDYKIYPSILDAYAWYKKSESPECKQELIDKINRVPFQSEAADKGTAFNELVDLKISEPSCNLCIDKDEYGFGPFWFKIPIVETFAEELKGAIPQQRVEATIETDNGLVLLYGYADEILADTCIDIKTTKSYEFPKFMHNWQHVVYPYCLNQMGIECNNFIYLITDFNNIFKEEYKYNPAKQLNRLKAELNDFIFFLDMNKDVITDKKIFAMEDVLIAEPDKELDLILVK